MVTRYVVTAHCYFTRFQKSVILIGKSVRAAEIKADNRLLEAIVKQRDSIEDI